MWRSQEVSPALARYCCVALTNIAAQDHINKQSIVAGGGLPAIVAAATAHGFDEDNGVLHAAVVVLQILSRGGGANDEVADALWTVNTMSYHTAAVGVQSKPMVKAKAEAVTALVASLRKVGITDDQLRVYLPHGANIGCDPVR